MTSAPSMPLFCGDYLADTKHLTLEQHGAYMLLLMITWRNNGRALPDDDGLLSRYLSITKERWQKKIRPALEPLFDLSGGTWRSARLEREWDYVQQVIAKRREAGAKGGRAPKNGPNGPDFPTRTRENFSENADANPRKNNETSKANGSVLLKQNGSTHTYTSSSDEEEIGEPCVSVDANPPRAHTREAPPVFVNSGNVVPIKPTGRQEVLPLPDGWVLPAEWHAWAEQAGQGNVDGAAQRFFDFHFERGLRKTAAGWEHAWKRWIADNIKRGYGNGAGHHGQQRRANGDLASVVQSDLPGWFGYAEGGPNG